MPPTYRYSESQMRYRDAKSGRYVSDADIRAAVEQVASDAADAMAKLTARLRSGELTVDAWKGLLAGELKQAHLAIGVIGKGGRAAMTSADWGLLGSVIKTDYGYLRKMVAGVESGVIPIDAKLESRVRLYAETARLTLEHVRDKVAVENGFDQEKNVLGGAEQHCSECPSLSARGWVDAGSLPAIGSRECVMRCRCFIQRRRSPVARQQEAA